MAAAERAPVTLFVLEEKPWRACPPADRAAVFVSNQWPAEPCTEQPAVDLSTRCSPAAREKSLISPVEQDEPGQRCVFSWPFLAHPSVHPMRYETQNHCDPEPKDGLI